MLDVNCPYCNADLRINHDDGCGYEEDYKHQQDCSSCGKTFVFTTYISFSYDADKADCLNGAEHDYQKVFTIPDEFSKMRCTICDDDRDLTDQERQSFGIATVDEYFARQRGEL